MKLLTKILSIASLTFVLNSCSNINDPLPDFEAKTIKGQTITDEDLEGKIIVINLWATWCGPCVNETPELNKVVQHYKNNDDIVFLAITDESTFKVERLLAKYPFNYIQIAEEKLLKHKLHPGIVKSIPFHIIIGKDGITKFEYTGSRPEMSTFLINEIEKVINE